MRIRVDDLADHRLARCAGLSVKVPRAVGGMAVRTVLDAFERVRARARNGDRACPGTVAHLQFITQPTSAGFRVSMSAQISAPCGFPLPNDRLFARALGDARRSLMAHSRYLRQWRARRRELATARNIARSQSWPGVSAQLTRHQSVPAIPGQIGQNRPSIWKLQYVCPVRGARKISGWRGRRQVDPGCLPPISSRSIAIFSPAMRQSVAQTSMLQTFFERKVRP